MQIKVPCSKLTEAILKSQYKVEPIRLTEYDFAYHLVIMQRVAGERRELYDSESRILDASFQLHLPPIVPIENFDENAVGLLLHHYHYDMIIKVLEARTELEEEIKKSIEVIYEKFGITEDCLAIETITKKFYRLRKKNAQILHSLKNNYVRKKSGKCKVQKKQSKQQQNMRTRINQHTLQALTDTLIENHPTLVRNSRGHLVPSRVKAIKAYVYQESGSQSVQRILDLLNIKRRTYFEMAARVRKYLNSNA